MTHSFLFFMYTILKMLISLINELSLLNASAYFEIDCNRDINCIEAFHEYLKKPGQDTVTCMGKKLCRTCTSTTYFKIIEIGEVYPVLYNYHKIL